MSTHPVLSVALIGVALGTLGGCDAGGGPAASVFDREVLHKVEITVAEGDLAELATNIDNRVQCAVRYDGELIEGAGVRQKGNTLVELSGKPSFSIKFDDFDESASLLGLNKLLLNSADQDPTFLHEQIGADMYARAGLPAARIAHAVVSLNGEDKGLYVVAESIDKDFLRLHFGNRNDEGNLYEGPCCGDFVDDVDHMDLKDEQEDGRSDSDLRALAEVIQRAPDAEFSEAVGERLDLDRFITSYALEALLDHWDGYAFRVNNFYMYDNPADGRFVFIPHGMDRILKDTSFDPEEAPVAKLPLRIRAIGALDDQFHAELTRLVREAWDEESALAAIDRAASVIRTAGAGGQTGKDVAAFEENLGAAREALIKRRALLGASSGQ